MRIVPAVWSACWLSLPQLMCCLGRGKASEPSGIVGNESVQQGRQARECQRKHADAEGASREVSGAGKPGYGEVAGWSRNPHPEDLPNRPVAETVRNKLQCF